MLCGCRLLGEFITAHSARPIPPDERRPGERRHWRERTLQTSLGTVRFSRDYYWSPECTRIPFDEELGILNITCSPGLRRLMGFAASQGSYKAAGEALGRLAGLVVPPRQIQREILRTAPVLRAFLNEDRGRPPVQPTPVRIMYILTDGTGAPMRKDALEGRPGRQPDGSARTREVKLGCVFTDTSPVDGVAARDPQSTSYLANFKTASEFGADLLAEARHRGLAHAREVAFMGDGAKWIWELGRTHFPGAIEILDYYHAAEHLHELHGLLFSGDRQLQRNPLKRWKNWLWEGDIPSILKAVKRHQKKALNPEAVHKAAGYFQRNKHRMRYAHFRGKGLCIGSGVVEAACKTVVTQRMKQSGMFWSLGGAEAILDHRCAVMNSRYDLFWQAQAPSAA